MVLALQHMLSFVFTLSNMVFKKETSQSADRPFSHTSRPATKVQDDPTERQYDRLFPIAVWIMGIVSCYTTAVGLQPMLNSLVLSYAMAVALSLFLISIALQFPKAYRLGIQTRYILGYSFVAIFSVLLNFNAIYGVFTAEKLLYQELKENKSRLTALQAEAKNALDNHFSTTDLEENLFTARARLEEEKTNPRDFGYGKKARKINTEEVIPLSAQLETLKKLHAPLIHRIDSIVSNAQIAIDEALTSKDLLQYREAVDKSVDAYTFVGELTQNTVSDSAFQYQPIQFNHRDVGNLNHSLWTLGSLPNMEGRQASAVFVSLLLAFLIDFIVLFVLTILHHQVDPKEYSKPSDNIMSEENNSAPSTFSPFESRPEPGTSSIYASRRSNDPPKAGTKQKPVEQEHRRTSIYAQRLAEKEDAEAHAEQTPYTSESSRMDVNGAENNTKTSSQSFEQGLKNDSSTDPDRGEAEFADDFSLRNAPRQAKRKNVESFVRERKLLLPPNKKKQPSITD